MVSIIAQSFKTCFHQKYVRGLKKPPCHFHLSVSETLSRGDACEANVGDENGNVLKNSDIYGFNSKKITPKNGNTV